MSQVHELLANLSKLNVKVWREDERLRVAAPTGVLTLEMQNQLLHFKTEILQLFAQRNGAAGNGQPYTIQPVKRNGSAPLSFAQQRLWFLAQFEGASSTYNIPTAYRLQGKINRAAFAQALHDIALRHEILRTTFAMNDGVMNDGVMNDGGEAGDGDRDGTSTSGELVQQIAAEPTVQLRFDDLSALRPEEQAERQQAMIDADSQMHFDLASGPLLDAHLIRLGEEEHIFVLTLHHIIADGWSANILVEELCTLYLGYQQGKAVELPPLPIQYADFAYWQQSQRPQIEQQLTYWKAHLSDAPPLIEFPLDRPRPAAQRYVGDQLPIALPASVNKQLEIFCRQQGVTPYMALLATYAVLLSRYSGVEDLVIGTPVANRNRPEIEPLIGCFVNTLALRFDLSGNPTFTGFLQRVKEVALSGYANQEAPFEQVVEVLQPERQLSHTPIFQVFFNLIDTTTPMNDNAVDLPGLSLTPLEGENKVANFDLSLNLGQGEGALEGFWEYNSDIFELATIQRISDHYITLLTQLLADPSQPITAIPILSPAERQQLLVDWNQTRRDLPLHLTMRQLFERQVKRTPDAIAAACGNDTLTYRQLNERANRWAHRLMQRGVGKDGVVALLWERDLDLLTAILAIFKAGAAYLPLNQRAPIQHLTQVLQQSRSPLLLSKGEFLALSQQAVDALPTPQRPQLVDVQSLALPPSDASDQNPPTPTAPSDLAYVIYTSGSTGTPKGAMLEQRGMVNHLYAKIIDLQLSERDIIAQTAPQSFDISVWQFLVALVLGGRTQIMGDEIASDPQRLLAEVDAHQVTILEVVPSLLRMIVSEIQPGSQHFASLRYLVPTGEALPPALARTWCQRFPNIPIVNAYGPTECSDDVTHYTITREQGMPAEHVANMPIGRPVVNTQMYILDPLLQPVPIGVIGELYVGGVGVGRGYLFDPERTAQAFIANPFSTDPDARLYKTGDKARYLPDGNIEFLGRLDFQVKIRGFRIELGEIEAALGQHPAVAQSIVIDTPDRLGMKQLVAYVVRSQESGVKSQKSGVRSQEPGVSTSDLGLMTSDLRSFLADRLPDYMIPAAFVILDEMPLNNNGKIDRKRLPAPEWEASEDEYIAPQDETESLVAGIWTELLGVEKISTTRNFFELGGHSLLATQVVSRIRQQTGVDLPLRTFFATPTIADLACQIADQQSVAQNPKSKIQNPKSPRPPITPIDRTNRLPLSFAQERVWLLQQLNPESSFFNIPMALQLEGELDIYALQGAFDRLVERHESLRTTFPLSEGMPNQRIEEPASLFIQTLSLTHLPADKRQQELERMLEDEASLIFDLSQEPLWQVKLVRLEKKLHALFVTMHHIITDDWSGRLFLQEFIEIYRALHERRTPDLPSLPLQYADFAHWQRNWLQGSVLQEQIDYWKKTLADAPPLLELPTDHPRPAEQQFLGRTLECTISPERTTQLRRLSQQHQTTLQMTLLAAFATLLAHYSGMDDIVVGVPIAGRNEEQIEPLIGFFLNTLALRFKVADEQPFAQLLQQVRTVALAAYDHQDVPIERIIKDVVEEFPLSHSPLFQVMFNYLQDERGEESLPGLTIIPLDVENRNAKLDLTLTATESEEEIDLAWEYDRIIFDQATIERMARHFEQLLAVICADPQRAVGELPLLNEAEERQLLVDWNATQRDVPVQQVVAQLFEAQVARTPHAIAAVCGELCTTYQHLNQRANHWGWQLIVSGVAPERVVVPFLDRGLDFLCAILSIFKAGAAYLPIDPKTPVPRIQIILEQSRPHAILTNRALLPTLQMVCDGLAVDPPQVILIEELGYEDRLTRNLPVRVKPDNLAYVIFTSGSTGIPKGAMVEQRGLVNHLHAMIHNLQLSENDIIAQSATQSYVISVWQFLAALVCGCRIEIIPEEQAMNPAELLKVIAERQVTVLQIVPSLLRLVMDEVARQPQSVASLRWLIPTGEALPPSLARTWLQVCPTIPMLNAYGSSECSDDVAHDLITEPPAEDVVNMPAGRPIPNVQMYVLNRNLQPVPIGVAGELYVGGFGVGRGYLNDPERTDGIFVSDPFLQAPPYRLYKTGDKARYLPDGKVEYLGRLDFQVKVRGFRIELGEVEATLCKHRAVDQAVVVARDIPSVDAQGMKQLLAYVVLKAGEEVEPSQLRTFVGTQLPDYMIPSLCIILERMPLNANGKVDRKQLPAPEMGQLVDTRSQPYLAPRTPMERELVTILAEVLGIDADKLGVRHSFFDLGGHSLLAVQVIAKLRQRFGIELPLRRLFENTTVEGLANLLGETQTNKTQTSATKADPVAQPVWSPLVPLQPNDTQPPIYLIHPMGSALFLYLSLLNHLDERYNIYGIQGHGLYGGQAAVRSLPLMASEYIAAIKRLQPQGPYTLIGYSMGGTIAFEMAQQLHQQGDEVSRLILLDSYIFSERIPYPGAEIADPDERLITQLLYGLDEEEVEEVEDRLDSLKSSADRVAAVIQMAKAIGEIPATYQVDDLRRMFDCYHAHIQALDDYQPKPYAGSLTYLQCIDTSDTDDLPSIPWSKWVQGKMIHQRVPGKHSNLMHEPQVRALSQALHQCLQ